MPYTSSFVESFIGKTLIKPESFDLDCYLEDSTGAHKWRLKHYQSCCESVNFHSSIGDWPTRPITDALFEERSATPSWLIGKWESSGYGSHTWTVLSLTDGDNTISLAYLGESNGYYSEDVNLEYWMENETN